MRSLLLLIAPSARAAIKPFDGISCVRHPRPRCVWRKGVGASGKSSLADTYWMSRLDTFCSTFLVARSARRMSAWGTRSWCFDTEHVRRFAASSAPISGKRKKTFWNLSLQIFDAKHFSSHFSRSSLFGCEKKTAVLNICLRRLCARSLFWPRAVPQNGKPIRRQKMCLTNSFKNLIVQIFVTSRYAENWRGAENSLAPFTPMSWLAYTTVGAEHIFAVFPMSLCLPRVHTLETRARYDIPSCTYWNTFTLDAIHFSEWRS